MMTTSEPSSESYTPKSDSFPDQERSTFQEFLSQIDKLATPEEKVAFGLKFMRESISQEGTPRFREFWDVRRTLLSFFRQNINPAIRSKLWNEYVDLTIEARRLKEILEEQSTFAIEQIDLAISALEKEVARFDELILETPELQLPYEARSVQRQASLYTTIQRELNLLNHLASRLNGMRREILKTEMRVRFKTKLIKRLTDLGDFIFPKRKQLIEQIGAAFEYDVDQFIARYFQGDEVVGAPYYALRDEIKALQNLAKLITLNTTVFTQTRLKLSECWDKIKGLEKAHKQDLLQRKQVWTENRKELEAKLDALKPELVDKDLKQVDAILEPFFKEVRAADIGRDEITYFREAIQALRAPLIAEIEKKQKELEEIEREKIRVRKEAISAVKDRLTQLPKNCDKTAEEVTAELEGIRAEIAALELSKIDVQQMERLIRPIKDLIAERKEAALLNLSDDAKNALLQLKEMLDERKQSRLEIKGQLEIYRKMLSSSSLDLDKAMSLQEQMTLEKERLEKVNQSISEIEKKIEENF